MVGPEPPFEAGRVMRMWTFAPAAAPANTQFLPLRLFMDNGELAVTVDNNCSSSMRRRIT